MAKTKPKKTEKHNQPATEVVTETVVETEVAEFDVVPAQAANGNPMKGFFTRKFSAKENILTIFKSPRLYGALIAELIGTMIITMLFLTLGVYQPLYIMFGILAVTTAVCALSGANLNPLITVGMMATRRMSAIRGILYIVAQVLGAVLAFIVVDAFRQAGGEQVTLPVMSEVQNDYFWVTTLIEFFGATIIGFFFARALAYKRSAFTFGAIVAGGVTIAILLAVIVSSNFIGLQNNFILNPASAVVYQIFPNSGSDFGQLLGDIALAAVTYIIFPMLGGVIGFYLSDVTTRLSGEQK